jgi:beta-phosphoglucomutase-like phosphatase (HAD superfamily)
MEIRYHLGDWLADWQAILEQSLVVPKERENDAIRDYFLSRYHTPPEAKWRALRIFAALRYLEANAPSFEQAGYALASAKQGTVSKYLTSALYRFFGVASDEDVGRPPDPEIFIEAAAEHERNEP